MKISVAQRLTGGFGLIGGLLVIISLSAIYYLNTIESATNALKNDAIPTVSVSKDLQATFLRMSNALIAAKASDDSAQVSGYEADFTALNTRFTADIAKLNNLQSDNDKLRAQISDISVSYKQFFQDARTVFASHSQSLMLNGQVQELFLRLQSDVDLASSTSLELADDVRNDFPQLALQARIYSENTEAIFPFLNDLIISTTNAQVESVSNDIKIFTQLAREALQTVIVEARNNGILTEFQSDIEFFQATLDAIDGSGGLVYLKKQRFNKDAAAYFDIQKSNAKMQQSIAQIDDLIKSTNTIITSSIDGVSTSVAIANWQVSLFAIIAVVLAAIIAITTVRLIIVPLQKVNTLLHKVAEGDLTQTLDDSGHDEFAQLSRNASSLVLKLRHLIKGIADRADQLATASEQTSSVTLQTTHAIEEQKNHISEVAQSTSNVQERASGVRQNAEHTLNEINHANDEAKRIKIISIENKSTIETLSRDVDAAAQVINQLHQDSANITGILDVIRGVAEQTNLLALNAAIEAARAGEQGRGFAVVADEVRTLASRTQESTEEINQMLTVLQAGAERAVTVMKQGKEQSDRCVEQTDAASSAIDSITEAVKRAHVVSEAIHNSASANSNASSDMRSKLDTIVGIAQETSVGAMQTAESSRSVQNLADELRNSIKAFKVA